MSTAKDRRPWLWYLAGMFLPAIICLWRWPAFKTLVGTYSLYDRLWATFMIVWLVVPMSLALLGIGLIRQFWSGPEEKLSSIQGYLLLAAGLGTGLIIIWFILHLI